MSDQIKLIPFSTDDFSSDIAIQEERYYKVVDAVEHFLLEEVKLDKDAGELEDRIYRDGYARGVYISEYFLSIHYNRRLWRSRDSVETPFWFELWKEDGSDDESDFDDVLERIFARYPKLWKDTIGGRAAHARPLYHTNN